MNKMNTGLIVLICLGLLTACGEEEVPVDVYATKHVDQWNRHYVEVQVVSKTDDIELQNIVVDRGNCKSSWLAGWEKALPSTLKFGRKFTARFGSNCSVLQVDIETDQGDWTFDFN